MQKGSQWPPRSGAARSRASQSSLGPLLDHVTLSTVAFDTILGIAITHKKRRAILQALHDAPPLLRFDHRGARPQPCCVLGRGSFVAWRTCVRPDDRLLGIGIGEVKGRIEGTYAVQRRSRVNAA